MKKRFFYGILLSFISMGVFFFQNPFAQQNPEKFWGIIIEPAMFRENLSPGESIQRSLDITNKFQTKEQVSYFPRVAYFRQDGETGNPEFFLNREFTDEYDASSWVTVLENGYEINYEQTLKSNFTITVPEGTKPGGYYAAIVYEDKNATDDSVRLTKGVVSLIFITVHGTGGQYEDSELVEFTTNSPWYSFTPVEFIARLKNKGNVHTTIGGNIIIHQGDPTKAVAVLRLNQEESMTLPGVTKKYTETYSDGFITNENGGYQVNWDKFPKIYFGKYTAQLKLRQTVNNERVTIDRQIEFWIIPWQIILLVVTTIVLGGGAVYILRRKKENVHKSENQKK